MSRTLGMARTAAWSATVVVSAGLVLGPLAGISAAKTSSKVTFDSTPKPVTNQTTATFTWTAPSPAPHYGCFLDGAKVNCASTGGSHWSYTSGALADGTRTFVVRSFGQGRPAFTKLSWVIDTTGPAAPIIVQPPVKTRATSAAISFSDPVPGDVVRHTCAVDSTAASAASDCTSPKLFTGLANGDHTVYVTAYDAAGNGTTASKSWTVDPNAADIPVVTVAPGTLTNSTTADVSYSTANPSAAVECTFDGQAVPCANPKHLVGLADGSHTFTVTATDSAGNKWPGSVSWTVDTVAPPKPELVTGPAAITDDTTPTFVYTDFDPSGVVYTCSITDDTAHTTAVAATSCGATWTATLDANTPDGHQFTAHIVPADKAGNVGPALDVQWVLDQSIPVSPAVFLDAPSSPSNLASPTFTFLAPDAGQPNGATGFLCSLDGSTFASCGAPDANGQGTYAVQSSLSNDFHTFSVETTNGHDVASPVTWRWVVDTVLPPAPQVTPPGSTPNPTITFTDGDPSAIFFCSVDGGPFVPCGSPWTPPAGLSEGTHTLVVRAVDAAGNHSDSDPISFVVKTSPSTAAGGGSAGGGDTTAPQVTFTTPSTLTGLVTLTFSESVTKPKAGAIRFTTAGTTTNVPSAVACLSGNTAVSCAANFTSVRFRPTKALTVGQRYAVTADAGAVQDLAGNPLVAGSTTFRAAKAVEESNSAVRTSWTTVKAKAAKGGSFTREHLAGARASVPFTGTSVTWWTVTGNSQGKAAVYVDGALKKTVNNYAAKTHYRVARVIKGLSKGPHTLSVKVLGSKGAKAGRGTYVSVDAFTVGKSELRSVTYTLRAVSGSSYLGHRAVVADQKGEAVVLSFRGTSITWTTIRSATQGKAAVYVDGVLKATFDNYAKTTAYRVNRSVRKLADKVHTLRIVVLGTHHKGGKGTRVTVDRLTAG